MVNNEINRAEGFTLIELLVVIAIIGLLAALLLPSYRESQKKPYDLAAQQCLRAIVTAETTYRIEHGGSTTDSLAALGADAAEQRQNIQVKAAWGGSPTATMAGENTINTMGGRSWSVWTWSQNGSGAYVDSPTENLKFKYFRF